jgi:hypothetical protein
MQIHVKYFLLGLGIFLIISGMSFNYFNKYQPKVVRRVTEVRGAKTSDDANEVTLPQGALNVSFNQSYKSKQTTYQIDKSPKEIQNFYKTIFLEKGWEIDSEGQTNDLYVNKYKKENSAAVVISSPQGTDNTTIVSVETKTE